jgi:hypothetical protein
MTSTKMQPPPLRALRKSAKSSVQKFSGRRGPKMMQINEEVENTN